MQLDFRDSRPIYVQLIEHLRREILEGVLVEGDRLPSVRELSAQLAINPNTIQRAYRELEAQEWVVSIPGKGSFVRSVEGPGALRQKELFTQLDALAAELETLGVSREQLISHLKGDRQP